MIWFMLIGLLGILAYRAFKYFRYQSLQKKIYQYKNVKYSNLSSAEKQTLKGLVNQVLNSGVTLDYDTNQIVGKAFKEIEQEELYQGQGSFGLHELGEYSENDY